MQLSLNDKLDIERAHYFLQLGSYFDSLVDVRSTRYAFSGALKDVWYNQAYGFVEPIKSISETVVNIEDECAKFGKDPCLYLMDCLAGEEVCRDLEKAGYLAFEDEVWMLKNVPKSQENVEAKDITIVDVRSETEISDFSNVYRRGLPGDEVDIYVQCALNHLLNRPPLLDVHYLLAYYREIPVGMFGLINFGRYSGVYAVATVPEYQNRGICTALTKFAESLAAKSGASVMFLQTVKGEAAEKVFRALGFKEAFFRRGFAPSKIVKDMTHG